METLELLCTILPASSTQVINGLAIISTFAGPAMILSVTLELETSDFVTIDQLNRRARSEHTMSMKDFRRCKPGTMRHPIYPTP